MNSFIADLSSIGSQGLNHQDCESWLIGDQVSRVCHA